MPTIPPVNVVLNSTTETPPTVTFQAKLNTTQLTKESPSNNHIVFDIEMNSPYRCRSQTYTRPTLATWHIAPACDDKLLPSGKMRLKTANSAKIPLTTNHGNSPTEKNISHRTAPIELSLGGRVSPIEFLVSPRHTHRNEGTASLNRLCVLHKRRTHRKEGTASLNRPCVLNKP